MDVGVCTPSLSSPLSMASLLEYVRCIPHCRRNLFASSVQQLTYATLLFINNRTVSIPVSVITLAITWAYRCEYGVQLSMQYNLPRIRLIYYGKPHAPHDIFHHQAWRVVRPAVQITSCTYIQERINHVVLACIYIYRTQKRAHGWLTGMSYKMGNFSCCIWI